MQPKFLIYQSSTELIRPPLSSKVREYFESFINEHVFDNKRLAISGKWQIILSIHFTEGGPMSRFKRLSLSKGVTTVSKENKKIYDLFILTEDIFHSPNPQKAAIELMFEGISLFLVSTYKKVTTEFISSLTSQVDMKYLLSLPYPAPFEDQKYLLDDQLFVKNDDGTVRPSTLEEQIEKTGYKGKV